MPRDSEQAASVAAVTPRVAVPDSDDEHFKKMEEKETQDNTSHVKELIFLVDASGRFRYKEFCSADGALLRHLKIASLNDFFAHSFALADLDSAVFCGREMKLSEASFLGANLANARFMLQPWDPERKVKEAAEKRYADIAAKAYKTPLQQITVF